MTDLYRRFDGYEELKPLLDGSDEDVLVALGKPALIRIPGTDDRPRARLVSCLLHGNEDSGYRAVLDLLRSGPRFRFDLWIFIGNVRAASHEGWFAHRYLDDQEDLNRIWGLQAPTNRMRRCADEVLAVLEGLDLEGGIDLHNNTGKNPHYAILPRMTPETLSLAAACVDTGLVWNMSVHTLMEQLVERCPVVSIECGLPALADNAAFASSVLDCFLGMGEVDGAGRHPRRLFEILHRIEVRPEVPFAFGSTLTGDVELVLAPGLDAHNFGMLLAGTAIGRVDPDAAMPLIARSSDGRDVTQRYFSITADGHIVVAEDVIPVMMTTSVQQTRRDCLFYIARRRA